MLAIRRAFGEVARRNRLNLYGEHGHGGERYSENELLHVNLRRLSNRHPPPWRAGAVLNRRTPDGSAAMHPTQERRFVRPAPTARACEARTSGSARQRPGALQSHNDSILIVDCQTAH
jgi:hypothetical protein